MNEPNLKLGKILFDIRTEEGLSLREFSEKLNISHAYLNKLEKGIDPRTGKEVTPTIETLVKISSGIGINLNDLINKIGYSEIKDATERKEATRVISLEGLINEFLNAIYESDRLSFGGRILDISKKEIAELAHRELSLHIAKLNPCFPNSF